MEITVRDAITVVHGMLFGGLLLLCFSGAAVSLKQLVAPHYPRGWHRIER